MIPRRGAVALVLTTAALILLLSFKTPAAPSIIDTPGATSGGDGALQGPTAVATPGLGFRTAGPPAPTPTSGATGGTGGAGGATAGQFTGAVVQTPFGTVQVRITLSGGHLTDVTALQLPQDRRRSAQISQYAGPILRSEAIAAQSATIDTVTGATYTSEGYEESLQSALDQAHG